MADPLAFFAELSRQIKRHPEAYPTWLCVLADDVIEAQDNISRRERVAYSERDDRDAEAWRRFAAG